jgi:pantetheine-phosphate adenylyltransferase
MFRKKYQVVGMGGTFDHFHAGHAHFLEFASQLSEKLIIGITHERLSRSKPFAQTLEPYATRFHSVKQYCRRHNIRCELVELEDIFGPTLEHSPVQALCVTEETVFGSNKINETRHKLGLWEMPVYICDYLNDETGQPLHAENIRAGKVNRQGQVYDLVFQKNLTLSDHQRTYFGQPQGEIIDLNHFPAKSEFIRCVVGDNSLETFIDKGWQYNLGVFDHRRLRQPFRSETIHALNPDITISNPAGVITTELVEALKKSFNDSRAHIQVEGEEDLAAVALILLLPLESEVYYGQPNVGIICMKITEELKDAAYNVLRS